MALVRNPPCWLNIFVLQQQQNRGRRFSTCKMHLSSPAALAAVRGSVVVDSLLIVTPIVGFFKCSVFLLRYFVSNLVLQSS